LAGDKCEGDGVACKLYLSAMSMNYTGQPSRPPCENCNSTGWVCENDATKPWRDDPECGAGAPCPVCNRSTGASDLPDVSGVIETVTLIADEEKH
jgi:hypothetical protein